MKNLIVVAVVMILFATGLRVLYSRVATAAVEGSSNCVVLDGSSFSDEDGRAYIYGTVRNTCDRKFPSVTVTFKVQPQSNSSFPQTDMIISGYAHNLEPNSTATFKTQGLSNFASYRLDSIHAF